ncbi:MAG: hypothetical protein H5U14_09810, partial [Roseovarius sp.]|nr:hypothetical protein [Roseovarius sp.]
MFATVSGLVEGPWDEIGAFCDAKRLPCIFPNAELPTPGEGRYGYSVFFNRGLSLEAEALALYLGDQDTAPTHVVQLHGTGPQGTRPATSFATTMGMVLPDTHVETLSYDDADGLRTALATADPDTTLVIWPQDVDEAVAVLAANPPA